MTRTVVVVNPAAGGGRTERRWHGLRDELRGLGLAFDWVPTTGPGSATALARAAAEAGARARRVTLRAATPLPVHVDGEVAPATPVSFVACPGALRLRR